MMTMPTTDAPIMGSPETGAAPTTTAAERGETPEGATQQRIRESFKARIEAAKRVRKSLHPEWRRNVELRIGKLAQVYTGGATITDEIQTEVNPDWSLTKTKTANLYSQVPQVQGTHENDQYAAAIAPFVKSLNYELGEKRADVGVAMEEVLNDVVNAAGVGAVIVGYAARFREQVVPAVDPAQLHGLTPEQVQQGLDAKVIPSTIAKQTVSDRFYVTRISPSDLLWPGEFTGSKFDDADWVGRTGRCSWADAKHEFQLDDAVKEQVLSANQTSRPDNDLRSNPERSNLAESETVLFDEVFYWRARVDPNELNFHAIWRLVYVEGVESPVIDAPWEGQSFLEQTGTYVGACRFPVRILTLTYITDNPIPPSDSAAGRPQVNDLRRSRSQMFSNRERSIPIRWFDVNRTDPMVQQNLMRGVWQGMIPMNGDGGRAIGEIARASYPSEDFSFDRQTKDDLLESWQIGPAQMGVSAPGDRTKAEVQTVQGNFATRIGQERARVATFFLGIAEVLAGLMCLYSDFPVLTPQQRQQMESVWDHRHMLHDLVLKIRPDSTIMLEAQERVSRLMQLLNMTVKSGYVNPQPIIREIVELSGMDPAEVMTQPQPPVPDGPNISYSFKGKEDLANPMVVALLMNEGKAPTADNLEKAKQLLQSVLAPPAPPPPAVPQGAGPSSPVVPGAPGGLPPLPVPPPDTAHPDWHSASKVIKRSRDVSSNG